VKETQRRREAIAAIVADQRVRSQEELVEQLRHHGVVASQATVSRDLDALQISKRGRFYALPDRVDLGRILDLFVDGIDASGNLAVVRTPPGTAGTVAAAIDGADIPGVLATVQGDDTILVVAVEGTTGRALAARLNDIKESHS
jgi:transcriptional regulator of arginine metabolism